MCWICDADWMTDEEKAERFRHQAEEERAQRIFIAIPLAIGFILGILEGATGPWF